MEGLNTGGDDGPAHSAPNTSAGQDSRRARTARDTQLYNMIVQCMPNDLLADECRHAAGAERPGLVLWAYLTELYWGVDTLGEVYDLDDKWRAITINKDIGKDAHTPQRLMTFLRVATAKFPRAHAKSPDEIGAKFLLCMQQSFCSPSPTRSSTQRLVPVGSRHSQPRLP